MKITFKKSDFAGTSYFSSNDCPAARAIRRAAKCKKSEIAVDGFGFRLRGHRYKMPEKTGDFLASENWSAIPTDIPANINFSIPVKPKATRVSGRAG